MASIIAVAGCGDATGPVTGPRPSVACMLEVISGDGQAGVAGSLLDSPLTVRVTDSEGNAVSYSIVIWSSSGRFLEGGWEIGSWTTRADRDGVTQTEFAPSTTGASWVRANTAQCESSTVTFSFDVRPADWPALGAGTSDIFDHVGAEGDFTSRYVLEPDSGTFRLQFRFCCFAYEYLGVYTVEGTDIAFRFTTWRGSDDSVEYDGQASGTILGNTLAVHYEGDARWDFGGDAVYQRVP